MSEEDPPNNSPEQNPYESPEKVSPLKPAPQPTVLAMVGIAAAVLASSAIAFCCTCISVGLFTFELHPRARPAIQNGIDWYAVRQFIPWIVGLIVAIFVGYRVRRSLGNRPKQ